MNVSLVYNNKKLIGKCSKYAIEKVQGTSPFVMLENFEPEQPQLNENKQIVLEWLKEHYTYSDIGAIELIWRLKVNSTKEKYRYRDVYKSYRKMTNSEQLQILVAFAQWGLEQEVNSDEIN